MKPLSTTLLAFLPLLAACSGESTPVFDDPVTAMEQAEAAEAAGDADTAQAAYRYASEHGSQEIKSQALLGLCVYQADLGQEKEAQDSYAQLLTVLEPSKNQFAKIIQAAHDARLSDFGQMLLVDAMARHPAMREDLLAFDDAFEGFRTGVESDLDLGAMGYVDD